MSSLGAIEKLAKRNSRQRTRKTLNALITVSEIGFHMVSLSHFALLSLTRKPSLDMERLSMMTGKDFTGPVPVIRAKSPPNLEPTNPETERAAALMRKQSRAPTSARHANDTGAEVEPGQASSGRSGVKAAPSSAPQKAKKPANELSQNDVEVLGTIDDDWD
jgi:transcription factor TFIIIB component B''